MKVVVKKLFKHDPHTGDYFAATATVSCEQGQTRLLRGKIGSLTTDGEYTATLLGDGDVTVAVGQGVTVAFEVL